MASIAEQIRNLSCPKPTNFDPEEDDFDTTRAKLVSKNVGEELDGEKLYSSSLRKKNIALLADEDTKYHGKPVSRGELARMRGDFQDSDESMEDDQEDDSDEEGDIESDKDRNEEENTMENDKDESLGDEDDNDESLGDEDDNDESLGDEDDNDESLEDDDDKDEDEEDDYDDDENGRGINEEEGTGIDSFSSSRREEEIEKGMAVKQQLSLWDNLLEYRIRIQKAMMLANKLPQSDNVHEFTSSSDINLKSVKDKERKSLKDLLYKLLMVQEKLLEGNPETKNVLYPGKKTSKQDGDDDDDEEIKSDSEGENEEKESEDEEEKEKIPSLRLPSKRKRDLTSDEFSEYITRRHGAFQSYQDSVISKWSEKTRLASGKLSSKSFSAFDKSALTQIKQILSDKPRLIKRTQLKRSSYRVLGKAEQEPPSETETQERANSHLEDYDREIFDDDDFYHQLLRELIERRTTTNTDDPIEMGRQWLELQKLRRKIKKKIDTKASKGRKLRYNVHSKLVGYMPPIERGTMQDSSRNELFSSLFGQSKTQTDVLEVDVLRSQGH